MNSIRILLTFCLCLTFTAMIRADEPSQPLIVAHRGLLRFAPENTLANFRACLELRLGFELDVQRTKDGRLVCIHDSTLDRTTNGTGKVSEHTLAEIRGLDAGSWFDNKFSGEKVPTIDEVFRLIAQYLHLEILIAADIKEEDVENEVVRLAQKHKVLSNLLFIGRTIVEPEVRKKLKKASPKARVAVVANNPGEYPKAVNDPNADWVYVRFLPTKQQIKAARQAKKPVFIAGPTVSGNTPDNWNHATKVGINAILTDYPLSLRVTLRQHGKGK